MTSRSSRGRWARSAALTTGAIAMFSLACEMPTPVAVDDEPQVIPAEEIQWTEHSSEPLRVFVTVRIAQELAEWVYVDQSELQDQVRRASLTKARLGEAGYKSLVKANSSTEGRGRELQVYRVFQRIVLDMKTADSGR